MCIIHRWFSWWPVKYVMLIGHTDNFHVHLSTYCLCLQPEVLVTNYIGSISRQFISNLIVSVDLVPLIGMVFVYDMHVAWHCHYMKIWAYTNPSGRSQASTCCFTCYMLDLHQKKLTRCTDQSPTQTHFCHWLKIYVILMFTAQSKKGNHSPCQVLSLYWKSWKYIVRK